MKVGEHYRVRADSNYSLASDDGEDWRSIRLTPGETVTVIEIITKPPQKSGARWYPIARLTLPSKKSFIFYNCLDPAEIDEFFVKFSPLEELALCAEGETDES